MQIRLSKFTEDKNDFVSELNLTVVISDMGSGGAQRVLINMLNEWAKQEYQLALITINSEQEDFFQVPDNIKRIRLFMGKRSSNMMLGAYNNMKRIFTLRNELKKMQPDIVLSFIGATNIIALLSSIGLGSKVIISERNDPSRQSLGLVWDLLRKIIYPLATCVTANSKIAINTMSSYVNIKKLKYTPNPVVIPDKIIPVRYQRPSFLAVGRLEEQKAYDIILQAFAESDAKRKGWGLTILGDGALKDELVNLAVKLDINDCIDWKGKVNNPFSYYASAKAFLLPSRFEGMPNSLLEAMSMGLPCVISDALQGPAEFVVEGKTGWVVPVGDVKALSSWMTMIMGQSNDVLEIAKQGKEEVLQHMSMNKSLLVWESIFDSVMSTKTAQNII